MKTTAPRRPALRYHGGKWMLAPWIISHFPPHKIYVEPYGGGASVLLRKPRSHSEVYNDLDGRVVNLFRVLQNKDQAAELIRLLMVTPFSRDEFNLAFNLADEPIERARRLIIRSFMGHSGESINRKTGFRKQSSTAGKNTSRVWAGHPDSIALVVVRMLGVVIENKEGIDVIRDHDRAGALFYCDPPYTHGSRSAGSDDMYKHEMSDRDHEALAEELRGNSGMIIISGYPGELYNDLYSDWAMAEMKTTADSMADKERTEVLWMNAACVEAQQQKRLF